MENGNSNASALIILAVFTVPLILWYLGYLWTLTRNWLDNTDNLGTDKSYHSKYDYINKNKETIIAKYFKENKKIERERPPNASFFCRVDGKETKIEGPYEEQFLTRVEKIKWECKKRRRRLEKLVE